MSPLTRREFLKTTLAAGAAVSTAGSVAATLPLHAEIPTTKRTAFDKVTLGRSGVKATRLAFGTGTDNGYVLSSLGQKEVNRLVAYSYERGIRFFETAEAYMTPAMLGEALKPYPRESYVLMHKVTTNDGDPHQRFDDMLRTMQTPYFDIMLLHWQHTADWVSTTKRWQDGIDAFPGTEKNRLPRRKLPWSAGAASGSRQRVAPGIARPHQPQRHAHGRPQLHGRQQPRQPRRSRLSHPAD